MSKLDKILIPTDFSHAAQTAIDYALSFVEDNEEVTITLLHISSHDLEHDESEKSEAELEKLCRQIGSQKQITCETLIRVGALTETIASVQAETGSDLIIMGTKGAADGEEATNTSELVLAVDCPVLVVPPNTSFKVENIALALGKNEIDDTFSLSVLHNIARKFGAKVHVLTIDNDDSGQGEDKNESALEYYLETLDYQYAFPKNSDIEKGIFDYVKDKHIDLLAILPRNHAQKSSPSEGRLTELLTLHTKLPLLTID